MNRKINRESRNLGTIPEHALFLKPALKALKAALKALKSLKALKAVLPTVSYQGVEIGNTVDSDT